MEQGIKALFDRLENIERQLNELDDRAQTARDRIRNDMVDRIDGVERMVTTLATQLRS